MACILYQYTVVGFGDVYSNEPTKYHLVIILQMRKQDPEGIGNMFKCMVGKGWDSKPVTSVTKSWWS